MRLRIFFQDVIYYGWTQYSTRETSIQPVEVYSAEIPTTKANTDPQEPHNQPRTPTKTAKTREYEKQIDQLVYKLYGLTPEEIKIVENS